MKWGGNIDLVSVEVETCWQRRQGPPWKCLRNCAAEISRFPRRRSTSEQDYDAMRCGAMRYRERYDHGILRRSCCSARLPYFGGETALNREVSDATLGPSLDVARSSYVIHVLERLANYILSSLILGAYTQDILPLTALLTTIYPPSYAMTCKKRWSMSTDTHHH